MRAIALSLFTSLLLAAVALGDESPPATTPGWPVVESGGVSYSLSDRPSRTLNTHRGLRVALAYFGQLPAGCSGITFHRLIATPLRDDAQVLIAAMSNPGDGCTIWITPNILASKSKARTCTIIVHEIGHLLGLNHEAPESVDPDHVMASPYTHAIGACRSDPMTTERPATRGG